jgi:hypothetical protein
MGSVDLDNVARIGLSSSQDLLPRLLELGKARP